MKKLVERELISNKEPCTPTKQTTINWWGWKIKCTAGSKLICSRLVLSGWSFLNYVNVRSEGIAVHQLEHLLCMRQYMSRPSLTKPTVHFQNYLQLSGYRSNEGHCIWWHGQETFRILWPCSSSIVQRYKFYNCNRQDGESIANFVTVLKETAKFCDYNWGDTKYDAEGPFSMWH